MFDLQISDRPEGNALVVALTGRLDPATSLQLDARLAACPPGNPLVLDLAGLGYISNAGLRAILAAHKRRLSRGGRHLARVARSRRRGSARSFRLSDAAARLCGLPVRARAPRVSNYRPGEEKEAARRRRKSLAQCGLRSDVPQDMRRLFFAFFLLLVPPVFAGTIVEIRMPIGTIGLELYDTDKPITVSNFLNYITSGRYENTFAHRLEPGFVLQGGGFLVDDTNIIQPVTTSGTIENEYSSGTTYSNTFGTIAMARVLGQVDSATSQWFINLADNTGLDTVDEGFTVFGHVIYGFDVLTRLNTTFADDDYTVDGVFDASSNLNDSNFGELPLLSNSLTRNNILFTDIVIVPEPSSLGLCALGVGVIFLPLLRRRLHDAHRTH